MAIAFKNNRQPVAAKREEEPPCSRAKQRDYTIPVRLNQLLPFSKTAAISGPVSRQTHGHDDVTSPAVNSREKQQPLVGGIIQSEANNMNNTNSYNKSSSSPQSQNFNHLIKMIERIRLILFSASDWDQEATLSKETTTNKKREKKKFARHSLSHDNKKISLVACFIVMAAVTLTINTKSCLCDTSEAPGPIITQSLSTASSTKQHQQFEQQPAPLKADLAAGSSAIRTKNADSSSQKENLLSSLADQIERQHFKLKPSRSKLLTIRQRPSKFDSAEYLSDSLSLEDGIEFISKKGAKPLASTIKKVDDSMRQILRMHETAAASTASAVRAPPPPAVEGAHSSRAASKRLRKLSGGSLPNVATALDPTKVVSKVLAYVSPLMVSKLAAGDSSTGSGGLGSADDGLILLKSFNGSSFGGRSNTSKAGYLFPQLRHLPTASPQTSSLMRPDYFLDGTRRGVGKLQPTPPSASLADNAASSESRKMASSSKQTGDPLLNDLLAESSDLLSESLPVPTVDQLDSSVPANKPQNSHNHLGGSNGFGQTTSGLKPLVKRPLAHHQSGTPSVATKLKYSVNQMAQNYLKNSFRDLITLSQLPILSTTTASSTVSTAPSVLEKKRPKRRNNKLADKVSQSPYQDQRRRFVEELYRYIYMLGTGVKNKRDPLEALGSSSRPKLTASNLKKHYQKSVFSQRSINQLVASNHNQLMDYATKIRNLLITGPMSKARPRGVMWDMATDPSLAVTVFHLLERASVALPLGFLLLPFVQMIRHPLNGMNLGRIIPARASHRSVDIEELAKRLDVVDKMLSRALRSTHRESFIGK